MTVLHRGLIETELQNLMEAGRFQGFMLTFLPLYDPKYIGIHRHGGTPYDKPRMGVPDLIKDFPNGDQIFCECSTDKNYWDQSGDSSNWKPIQDGIKCFERSNKLIEVILATNQPVPVNSQNAKSIIKDLLKPKAPGNCEINIFSSEEITIFIANNLTNAKFETLLEEFFPHVFKEIKSQQEKEILRKAMQFADAYNLKSGEVLNILNSLGFNCIDSAEEMIITKLYGDESRFARILNIEFQGVPRYNIHDEILKAPFGKVIQLIGGPKVGKTTLGEELVISNKLNYSWFDVPVEDNLLDQCVEVIQIKLLSFFWSKADVVKCVRDGRINSLSTKEVNLKEEKICLVIDNAGRFKIDHLKRIDNTLSLLKSKGFLENISVMFISNTDLNNTMQLVINTVAIQHWSKSEIELLIAQQNILITDPESNAYLELLQLKSKGHPLLALVLVKKYPTIERLFNAPPIEDADLIKEIKSILYRDILANNPDKENFVQRLSLLDSKHDIDVLESLREVEPTISKSISNLCDEIGFSVLEGAIETGVMVSPIFAEVAKNKISEPEKIKTYRSVAKVLLKPNGEVFDAEKILSGILYLIKGKAIGRAVWWAVFLLTKLYSDKISDEARKYILNRLISLLVIMLPTGEIDYYVVCMFRFLLASHYLKMREYEVAIELLEQIDLGALEEFEKEKADMVPNMKMFRAGIIGFQSTLLKYARNPAQIINNYIDFFQEQPTYYDYKFDADALLEMLIFVPKEKYAKLDFIIISNYSYETALPKLMKLATHVGLESRDDYEYLKNLKSVESGAKIFQAIALSSAIWNADTTKNVEAMALIEDIEPLLVGFKENQLGPFYYQHKGDLLYSLGRFKEAADAYQVSCSLEKENNVVLGWNHYKMGLALCDQPIAEEHFLQAKDYFLKVNEYRTASCAIGALAAFYIKRGKYDKAFDLAMLIADWFYDEQRAEVGTALRLLLAQIKRTMAEIEKQPIPAHLQALEVNPRLYNFNDNIKLKEVGGMVSYFVISDLAKIVKDQNKEIYALKKAIFAKISDNNFNLISVIWHKYFSMVDIKDIDEAEIYSLLSNIIPYQPKPGDKREQFFLYYLFRPFEERTFSSSGSWASIFLKMAESVEILTDKIDAELSKRWQPYIYFAKGYALFYMQEYFRAYTLLKEAATIAMKDGNWLIGEFALRIINFNLIRSSKSMHERAKLQYDYLLCLKNQDHTSEKIQKLGEDLLKFWSGVSWQALNDLDIRVDLYLLKSAYFLKEKGFTPKEAAPIMLKLLLEVFHDKDQAFLPVMIKEMPQEFSWLFKM